MNEETVMDVAREEIEEGRLKDRESYRRVWMSGFYMGLNGCEEGDVLDDIKEEGKGFVGESFNGYGDDVIGEFESVICEGVRKGFYYHLQ